MYLTLYRIQMRDGCVHLVLKSDTKKAALGFDAETSGDGCCRKSRR